MNIKVFITLLFVLIILVSGCTQNKHESPPTLTGLQIEKLKEICIQECKALLKGGKDMSSGPCILNIISNYPDWVCDIAHSPRQDIDEKQENQCPSFNEGKTHHFVELSPTCEFIRAI